MTTGIDSFETLHVHEWKSFHWAPNVFSARGEPVGFYSAGTALLVWLPQVHCHPAFCEPTLLLCVMQGQELVWAPRTQISPLTFSIHSKLPELHSPGQKNGWEDAAEVRTWFLNPIPFSKALDRAACSMCKGSTMAKCDHCRENYPGVCPILALTALEEAVWGIPWAWWGEMSTS